MSVFFDTNIFVYAFSDDARRERSQNILSAGGVISVQVVNELVNVLRKKQRRDWVRRLSPSSGADSTQSAR